MTGTSAAGGSGFPRAVGPGDLPAAPAPGQPAQPAGYRGPTACAAAGITYRQLDYWARTGLVEPSIRSASGSGSQRLYGFRDIIALKIVKRLLDTGVSLQNIRIAVGYLRARGEADLAGVTLMSDGASVYECTSPTEVFDLVQGGQGVFGIAVDAVCREVEGTLRQFPGAGEGDLPGTAGATPAAAAGSATASGPGHGSGAEATSPEIVDELARRRRIKAV
ncbi:MerR family transcriptional regulator [Catenulispora sp. NF23]|uniref:MerR family transcriptional regulator n=1 Tax=Catenulispora pinistramenti TaxID=2705254 RepID=A0ABS5KYS3_9ACTN|nr:MerR family transcriptional regulator [Catenulispora pinistramenti]MBS2538708.1 MerR family transcriptional regulator [Catenulispora pinistramenti]MBS2551226.1 MerR family transcriptional regulator [Catenulispora pinistramenti]